MNAYELADEYGTYAESHDWGKQAQDMLRQQADQIELLEKQVARLKEIIEKSIDMNNALGRM